MIKSSIITALSDYTGYEADDCAADDGADAADVVKLLLLVVKVSTEPRGLAGVNN